MENEDSQIKPAKDFFIKLAIVPFGVVLLFFVIFGLLLGFTEVLRNAWQLFVAGFLFLEAIIMFTAFIVSRRFIDFFKDAGEKSFFVTLGLFLNLIAIIYKKPSFLLDFHPFQEDFSIILTATIAWIIFFIVSYKRTKRLVPKSIQLVLLTISLLIVMVSIIFFAMVDILIIFFQFFPIR